MKLVLVCILGIVSQAAGLLHLTVRAMRTAELLQSKSIFTVSFRILL